MTRRPARCVPTARKSPSSRTCSMRICSLFFFAGSTPSSRGSGAMLSGTNLAENNVRYIPANPNLFAAPAQMNATRAAERRALGCDIGRLCESGAEQPLRKAGVETAGDRVLVSAAPDERPHLEGRVMAGVMRTHHAELERIEGNPVGLERKHLTRGTQHHRAPARAIVYPLVPNDIRRRHSQRLGDLRQHIGLERSGTTQRRRGELQARTVAAHADEAHAALLDHEARLAWLSARGEPGVA